MAHKYYIDQVPRKVYSWDEVPVVIDTVWMARLSGFTETYVRILCRKNKIPAKKTGTEWKADRDAFREWLTGVSPQQKGAEKS